MAPDATPPGALVGRIEGRLVEMLIFVRLGTSTFLYLPLAKWSHLERSWIVVVVAVVGTAWAVAFAVVTRRRGLTTPVVVGDVVTCLVLMGVGSRAVAATGRNVIMTELIPYSLGASAVVGFSTVPLLRASGLVLAMMLTWLAALYPVLPLKTLSDQLGFALWLVISRAISSSWRRLAETADQAQREASQARARVAEQERQAVTAQQRQLQARHREALHREVHDFLLPVVEHVAAGNPATTEVVAWAGRTARRARLRLENELTTSPAGLLGQLAQAVSAAEARGLTVESSLATRHEPPAAVVDVLVAAVTEALTNVAKHSRVSTAWLAALELGDDGVELTVRDRGRGFDPDAVRRGGGLTRSFTAVRSHGGRVGVESAPGEGTRVTIEWRPAARDHGGAVRTDHGGAVESREGGPDA